MKKILGMGNALVDILVTLENDKHLVDLNLPKGSMQLVDKNKMNSICEVTDLYEQHIASGGSASNTITALARLGIDVGFIGKVGDDKIGKCFAEDLKINNVKTHLLVSEMPSGRCHVLISNDYERTMATYLGAANTLSAEDLDISMFTPYDILHIEGYLVQNYDLITRAGQLAKKAGLKVSIDLASYNIVSENIYFLHNFVEKYVDIVFANELETSVFTGKTIEEALNTDFDKSRISVIKVGANGSYIKKGKDIYKIPAVKANTIDTTGAGDVYAAGFLYGYANNLPLQKCGEIGAFCAAQVIEEIGAKISDERWDKIHKYIK